jgi:hypothetical protein
MADPSAFVGARVNWTAIVDSNPVNNDTYISFRAIDPSTLDRYIVETADLSTQTWVKENSYVQVIGNVTDAFPEGDFGRRVIRAALVSKLRIVDVEAPALQTVTYGTVYLQNGFEVKLDRVELAAKETRVYLTLTNHRTDDVSFMLFGEKLTKGSQQFEQQPSRDTEGILPDALVPGVQSSGAIVFPAMSDIKGAKIYLGAPYSKNDLGIDFKEVVFTL